MKQPGCSGVICGTLFYLLFDLLCSRTVAFPAWHCCFAISLWSCECIMIPLKCCGKVSLQLG